MKNEKNIKNFDYITIVIKKEKQEEILKIYKCLGWEILSENQHQQYVNLVEVEFVRNHFIPNKDTLQFLQVNLENDINKKGRLERNKHSKSLALGLSLGLTTVAFIILAVLSFLDMVVLNTIFWGCLFSILALSLAIFIPIIIIKTYRKEKIYYVRQIKAYDKAILEHCKIAKELTGENNGK